MRFLSDSEGRVEWAEGGTVSGAERARICRWRKADFWVVIGGVVFVAILSALGELSDSMRLCRARPTGLVVNAEVLGSAFNACPNMAA